MTQVVIARDRGQPIAGLMVLLAPTEQRQAEAHRAERRCRHFALGRLAAHGAVERLSGVKPGQASIEVLNGTTGRPVVLVDGLADVVSVSVSHSSRLAAACAWFNSSEYAAGVDVERIRPNDVAESEFAFSLRERSLLLKNPEGRELAGLAAWTVKEAVWKALHRTQCSSPAEIEIRALDLVAGWARVEVSHSSLDSGAIRTRVNTIDGPDGTYLLTVAEVGRHRSGRPRNLSAYAIQPG